MQTPIPVDGFSTFQGGRGTAKLIEERSLVMFISNEVALEDISALKFAAPVADR